MNEKSESEQVVTMSTKINCFSKDLIDYVTALEGQRDNLLKGIDALKNGMVIKKDWKIEDEVSGLRIEVITGNLKLNKLHIESLDGKMNRDFWFAQDGVFDGTGSSVEG